MSYLKLKGVSHIGESLLCEQLEANIVEYLKWGLLGIGGFSSISRPTSGAYGGDFSRLRPVSTPNFTNGRVWEAIRQDWVWESGVDYGYQPISVSGVYVNNTFYPSNTSGAYKHYVSYPDGQVVFDSPISTSSTVQVEYSYRNFYVSHASVPWFKQLFFNSHRPDNPHFLQNGSGIFELLAQNRVQLPAIIVEVVPDRNMRALQIVSSPSGGGQIVSQDVLFHIITEGEGGANSRNKAMDIITYQKDATLALFDKNAIIDDEAFPLDYRGALNTGALTYPELVKFPESGGQYFWSKMHISSMRTIPTLSVPPLYRGTVKGTFEIDLHNI